jgi:hypothetical protein
VNVIPLHVEQGPNFKPLMEELNDPLAGRGDVAVTAPLVRSAGEAQLVGFPGSPTILIEGQDPFPSTAGHVGLRCRQ